MLDIRWIRENPEEFDRVNGRRGHDVSSSDILALDGKRRDVMTELQALQSTRNDLSKQVGMLKSKGEDAAELMAQVQEIGPQMKVLEEKEREAEQAFLAVLSAVPNLVEDSIPDGEDEEHNVEVRKWGEPKTMANPQHHYDLGEALGGMRFDISAKMSGSRFAWMQGDLARLERALGNFMLDLHTREFGFTEVMPPMLVNDEAAFGTGQLPKFSDDLFQTTDGRWLLPTAEVPVTNFASNTIFKEEELPFKFAAWTQCFRREAGSAGRDTRGYIRMHQFGKVEMVQLVHPEKSDEALEFMTSCAEEVLKRLEIPFRVITLCTGDIGFGARKTYDVEVWVPAQDTYREISSCSNCGDFQARRMKARFKDVDGQTRFIHTLNGSGIATGRAMVAVMENYQQQDGSIIVPDVLIPYMGGQTVIEAK
ncbi:MAG: serine--tRNA ligase [Alphaproteobacteria bacterium]|nr:serine--tRNA ligase [Alphaproteobacteria bacterium]